MATTTLPAVQATDLATLLADLHKADATVETLAANLAEWKAYVTALENLILATMQGAGLQSAGDTLLAVHIGRKVVYNCHGTRWPDLYDYIKANDAFDILHRRLSLTAIRARFDAGEVIPAIETVGFDVLKRGKP